MARALLGRGLLVDVAARLASERIEVAPLKGMLFHLRSPGLTRRMVDVDIAVRPSARDRALAILEASGFRERGRGDGTQTLRHEALPIDLDVHWRLFQTGLFRLSVDAILDRSTRSDVDGATVSIPEAPDVLAHLVGHYARDRHDGTERRHLDDFALFSKLWTADARECARRLDACGLRRAACYVLPLVVDATADELAAAVLSELDCGWRDRALAQMAAAVLSSHPGSDPVGALGCHMLNSSLPRGLVSFAIHGTRGVVTRGARLAQRGSGARARGETGEDPAP